MKPSSGTRQAAGDGRSFTTGVVRCYHADPCWCAWCACGEKLTAHAFSEEDAAREARSVMASDDPRPGFGHSRCR